MLSLDTVRLVSEVDSLPGLRLTGLAMMDAGEPQGFACFCLPGAGITGACHHDALYMGPGGSNSGPYICKANASLTDLSLQRYHPTLLTVMVERSLKAFIPFINFYLMFSLILLFKK